MARLKGDNMSQSNVGKGDSPRPVLVSEEERTLRYAYGKGWTKLNEKELKELIKEIRKETGKP